MARFFFFFFFLSEFNIANRASFTQTSDVSKSSDMYTNRTACTHNDRHVCVTFSN